MDDRLRFASESLQRRFVAALVSANVPFTITETGDVQYSRNTRADVTAVARSVRDSCFEWYLMWLETVEAMRKFRELLEGGALPFEMEHHLENETDRDIFLLPRADRGKHECIWRDAVRRDEPAFRDTGRAFVGLSVAPAPADDESRTFPSQELTRFAEHVTGDELVVGETYFQLRFVDYDLLVPELAALVFIGRNLEPDDAGRLYFQDAGS